jgi:hypothetical protein
VDDFVAVDGVAVALHVGVVGLPPACGKNVLVALVPSTTKEKKNEVKSESSVEESSILERSRGSYEAIFRACREKRQETRGLL